MLTYKIPALADTIFKPDATTGLQTEKYQMDYKTERKKHEIEDARQKMLAAWAAYEVAQAAVRAANDIYREKRGILIALQIALQRAEIDRQNGERSNERY